MHTSKTKHWSAVRQRIKHTSQYRISDTFDCHRNHNRFANLTIENSIRSLKLYWISFYVCSNFMTRTISFCSDRKSNKTFSLFSVERNKLLELLWSKLKLINLFAFLLYFAVQSEIPEWLLIWIRSQRMKTKKFPLMNALIRCLTLMTTTKAVVVMVMTMRKIFCPVQMSVASKHHSIVFSVAILQRWPNFHGEFEVNIFQFWSHQKDKRNRINAFLLPNRRMALLVYGRGNDGKWRWTQESKIRNRLKSNFHSTDVSIRRCSATLISRRYVVTGK